MSHQRPYRKARIPPGRGFTLLELAVVLVIIGLVVGGIVVGQDLIRAAELRKIHKQFEAYVTAAATFKGKYNCLPGDCDNATDVFPAYDPAGGTCPPTGVAPGAAVCDGNGDGRIADPNGPPTTLFTEAFGAWQQLADAGLIEGIFSGSLYSATQWFRADYNCPPALSEAYCWTWWDGEYSTSIGDFAGMTDDAGHLGAMLWIFPTSADYLASSSSPGYQMFSPKAALAYDTKFDDGHPDSGQVFAAGDQFSANCTTPGTGPADGQGWATGPFSYDVQDFSDQPNCTLVFRTGF